MQFADTHVHLQDYQAESAEQAIKNGIQAGITKFVCAAIYEKDWSFIEELAAKYPQNIVPAFGLHPWYVKEAQSGWEQRLESIIKKHPNALVGETGLDRHRDEEYEPQNGIFKKHIEIAKKYNRPLLIHAVRCPEWLEEYWNILPAKFVFHSYNARREMLKKIVERGGYVSFATSILNNREKEKTLRAVPAERLMLETDAPYQAANSLVIPELAKEIATIREENLADFAKQVYQNSEEFIKVGK